MRPGSTAVPLKARDTLSLGELITVVKLRERTRLSVDQTARRTISFLVDGAVAVAAPIAWQMDRRDTFEIRTRHAVAQSRGAAVWVEIGEPSATRVCVFTGTAVVSALGDADDRRVPVGPHQCVAVAVSGVGGLEPLAGPTER